MKNKFSQILNGRKEVLNEYLIFTRKICIKGSKIHR